MEVKEIALKQSASDRPIVRLTQSKSSAGTKLIQP